MCLGVAGHGAKNGGLPNTGGAHQKCRFAVRDVVQHGCHNSVPTDKFFHVIVVHRGHLLLEKRPGSPCRRSAGYPDVPTALSYCSFRSFSMACTLSLISCAVHFASPGAPSIFTISRRILSRVCIKSSAKVWADGLAFNFLTRLSAFVRI